MAYIKLEDAINHILNHTPVSCSADFFDGQMDCVNQLKSLPTADVEEVRHGYWKRNERNIHKMKEFHDKGIALSMGEKSTFYTCSCCNSWGSLSQKYCSECGAEMRGIKDA